MGSMERNKYWRRVVEARLSRRRLLARAAAGGLGLSAAAAVACGGAGGGRQSGTSAGNAPQAAAQPQRGGYLRHLAAYSAANIDPATTEDSTAYGFVETDWYDPFTRILYTPGVDWRIANTVTPWLAERFEQVDKTTYSFNV